MEKKQITKKQHYVSQGLLRLFSNVSTHIYECLIPIATLQLWTKVEQR